MSPIPAQHSQSDKTSLTRKEYERELRKLQTRLVESGSKRPAPRSSSSLKDETLQEKVA